MPAARADGYTPAPLVGVFRLSLAISRSAFLEELADFAPQVISELVLQTVPPAGGERSSGRG